MRVVHREYSFELGILSFLYRKSISLYNDYSHLLCRSVLYLRAILQRRSRIVCIKERRKIVCGTDFTLFSFQIQISRSDLRENCVFISIESFVNLVLVRARSCVPVRYYLNDADHYSYTLRELR